MDSVREWSKELTKTMRVTKSVMTIEGIGIGLGIIAVGFLLTHPDPLFIWLLEFSVGLGIPAALVYAGFKIGMSDFDIDEQWMILKWTVTGILLVGGLGLFIVLHQSLEGVIPIESTYILLISVSIGAACGVYGGMANAHSLHRLNDVESQIKAAQAEFRDQTASGNGTELSGAPRAELAVILSNDVRREIVEYFVEFDRASATPDELVDYLVGIGLQPIDSTSDPEADPRERMQIALHHTHLPRLDDAEIIRYTMEPGHIEWTADPAVEGWIRELQAFYSRT